MPDADIILSTFERAAQACADPAPLIYARLFELRPDFKPLFDMDTDGGVRGSMLETCFEAILGVIEGASSQRVIISAARFSHGGYGVVDEEFDIMFASIRDVFRDLLGARWTGTEEAQWAILLKEIAAIS
ncbi:globin domain protein [Hyphomonas neptunium ATCC 15444]|uniref:Globin domain protein n=2 Tax=Hyphomonas TaxID=85 RepID=Q0C3R3_HYPNA|nr:MULTISPECIES: globin [Hyphomonas]ABI77861.1 globin domain protein [Hyphomonas neptunium ATCC 15444]KCZ96159.1 globin domain-containing protein [Hyphomonas hirschiana VP5]